MFFPFYSYQTQHYLPFKATDTDFNQQHIGCFHILKQGHHNWWAYGLLSFHGDNDGDTLKSKYEQHKESISVCLSAGSCWSDE